MGEIIQFPNTTTAGWTDLITDSLRHAAIPETILSPTMDYMRPIIHAAEATADKKIAVNMPPSLTLEQTNQIQMEMEKQLGEYHRNLHNQTIHILIRLALAKAYELGFVA